MIVPKKDRKLIYSYLFKEGVICAKKDYMVMKKLAKDEDDNDIEVKNLYVIKLMTSLKSRGYVRETFSWQWYYWYLTAEGIEYLREYLNIPPEVVPDTLKKPAASERPQRSEGGRGYGRGDRGDRKWGGDRKSGFGRGRRMGGDDGYRRSAPQRS